MSAEAIRYIMSMRSIYGQCRDKGFRGFRTDRDVELPRLDRSMGSEKKKPVRLTCAKVRTLSCPTGRTSVVYTDAGGNLTMYISRKSKVWRYRFRFQGGNPENLPLGKWPAMSYEDAKQRVAEFERHRADGFHPRTLIPARRHVATVKDVLDHHVASLSGESQSGVISLYRDLRRDHGAWPVSEFNRNCAKNWIEDNYRHRPGAARTLIRNLTAAFNRAMDSVSGLLMPVEYEHPTSKIQKHISWLKDLRPGSLAVDWEDNEWTKVMGAIRWGYQEPSIADVGVMCIELIANTGARPSEIQSLRMDEIDKINLDGKIIHVIIKNRHKTWARTNRPRRIFLSREALDVIEKARLYREKIGYSGEYVFPSSRSNKNQKSKYVSQLTDLAHRLGNGVQFDFVPYNLRSAYINRAISTLGFDKIALVSENIGHVDTATTLKYYHRQRASRLAEAADVVGSAFSGRDRGEAILEGQGMQSVAQ